jgi:uncharacterized protein (TIGR00255 family)
MQMKQSKAYSMTGYVKHNASDIRFGNLVWEIKSLNNKYCDVKIHLPSFLNELENELLNKIKKYLVRGSVKVNLTYEPYSNQIVEKQLNTRKAQELKKQYDEMSNYLPLLKFNPNLFLENNNFFDTKVNNIVELKYFIIDSLSISLKNLSFMRQVEGEALWGIVLDKINLIAINLKKIKMLAKNTTQIEFEKILAKIKKIDVAINEDKIIQEAYFLAEKIDIQEEINRLESHVTQFLTLDESGEPIGKKAEFLCQEILRELNTIGSKSSNIEIINLILNMKVINDQIKEQVMNIV